MVTVQSFQLFKYLSFYVYRSSTTPLGLTLGVEFCPPPVLAPLTLDEEGCPVSTRFTCQVFLIHRMVPLVLLIVNALSTVFSIPYGEEGETQVSLERPSRLASYFDDVYEKFIQSPGQIPPKDLFRNSGNSPCLISKIIED